MGTCAYLGPEGSFSHKAAKILAGGAELLPQRNFYMVIRALLEGKCDLAVVPVFNSLNGGVMKNLDLMQQGGCVAVKETTIDVDHRLITMKGADISEITKVYSHPQALDQCAGYIMKNLPYADTVAVSSTAYGLDMIKSASDAAIASADAVRDGLVAGKENIADENSNRTQFLLLRKGDLDLSVPSKKVYISVTTIHAPGALTALLGIFGMAQINMSKIESRPIKDKPGEFRFFIELEGDITSEKMTKALESVRAAAQSFSLLGAY
ncbi:MAG: ACT domain-containing protein [Clostridia bacterium]|nr:ACT domain-containing protein [Clostridia bacterium]